MLKQSCEELSLGTASLLLLRHLTV